MKSETRYHLNRFVPEQTGTPKFPGSAAHWQSAFIYDDCDAAIKDCMAFNKKTGTPWRVTEHTVKVVFGVA